MYVVIPEVEAPSPIHLHSPRLAKPEQAADFEKEVIEVSPKTDYDAYRTSQPLLSLN